MKPKAQIRRRKDGRWRVTRPAFGFGQPERKTFDTWKEAIRWATNRIVSGHCETEQAYEGSDGIAARPRWSPLWPLNG